MQDIATADRVLQDAAEWLLALPEPTHQQLAAAGELLIAAAGVVRGQAVLTDVMNEQPNVKRGYWRPRPGGQPDPLGQLAALAPGCDHPEHRGFTSPCPYRADVSRETLSPASRRYYCTNPHHGVGEHDASCIAPAEPDNPELCLLRTIHGLCPYCNLEDAHEHPELDAAGNASSDARH